VPEVPALSICSAVYCSSVAVQCDKFEFFGLVSAELLPMLVIANLVFDMQCWSTAGHLLPRCKMIHVHLGAHRVPVPNIGSAVWLHVCQTRYGGTVLVTYLQKRHAHVTDLGFRA
jgi:hypothetical protein